MGPARNAFIGSLVGREAVGNAIVLQQLSMNGTRVIGPALAGVFISHLVHRRGGASTS